MTETPKPHGPPLLNAPTPKTKPAPPDAREARLATALRDNLRRRKQAPKAAD